MGEHFESNMKPYPVLIAFVLALSGCSTIERKVSVGTYRESGTSNFIRISSDQAQVHIEGVDKRDSSGDGLKFKYALWSDGQLWLMVSRSAELMYGYPALNYSWDGEKIVATNAWTGARWEFINQSNP